MTSELSLPEWADPDLYWQGWWAGHYTDKTRPLALDTELLRLIGEQDSWALGYRTGMREQSRG